MNDKLRQTTFEQLLCQHERQLFGYIFSLSRNLQDTEDLFQQTAITLWEKFDQFELGTNFAAWACTIARFRTLTFLERHKRQHLSLSEEAHAQLLAVEAETDPAELEERREALAECVKNLPEDQRELLLQFYAGERTAAELAEDRQRSTHSIYSSLRNTRGRLMECVQRVLARSDRS